MENYIFGLKSGQDLENRVAHSHQEFPGASVKKLGLLDTRHANKLTST